MSKKEKILEGIIIFIMALVFIAVSRYVYGAIQTKQTVDSLKNPAAQPLISDAQARSEFMSGCDTNAYYLQNEYCQCMYDEIREVSTVNELINDGLSLNQEQMESKYSQQINYCLTTIYEGVEL
jgi:hypothetical protein